jgi:hypothetical protein
VLLVRRVSIVDHRQQTSVAQEIRRQIQLLSQDGVEDLIPTHQSVQRPQQVDYLLGQSAAVRLGQQDERFRRRLGLVPRVVRTSQNYFAQNIQQLLEQSWYLGIVHIPRLQHGVEKSHRKYLFGEIQFVATYTTERGQKPQQHVDPRFRAEGSAQLWSLRYAPDESQVAPFGCTRRVESRTVQAAQSVDRRLVEILLG